ncbi:glycosyltransferase family 29 protein [Mesorhizobium sp. CC13]|uniref:glycosyltransferase family 29 protein n=1 Tax=Mesorhizobium sp. CC13 TaxID=3029194 RepID=UPI003265FD9D
MRDGEAKRRLAIVGNGPVANGLARQIDSSDIVVRFNDAAYEPHRTGTRTDILFLVNSGKTMQRRVFDPGFVASPIFQNAGRIVLPYHPDVIARYHPKPNILSRAKGRKSDWTREAIAVFGRQGKEVSVLPPQFYEQCCLELGIAEGDRRRLFPSTGFIGIKYALERFQHPEWQVELFGFSWEGWKRHAWEGERTWISDKIASGNISMRVGETRSSL